jgi:hypothetical protein
MRVRDADRKQKDKVANASKRRNKVGIRRKNPLVMEHCARR